MARTHQPDSVKVMGKTFKTNALPDPFDAQDLIYRPRLQVLPRSVDERAGEPILDQVGSACTGHAVATLINTVLAEEPAVRPQNGPPRTARTRVSPYMLYALARRYDEFPGTADVGSSLRGAFKGWHHHGVCKDTTWGPRTRTRDLYDPEFMHECADVPLGAYYRVNVRRIDDMQSAITELNAIAVSAAIHEGWRRPRPYAKDGGKPIWIIDRSVSNEPLGGHAFVFVGYNEVGFLVQNSWGANWGHKGYATLPYEDWLDNGYDAWVARPGVPQTLFARPRDWTVPVSNGVINGVGPNLARLPAYVIDVVANGLPSAAGKVSSSPRQIGGLAASMARQHDRWVAETGVDTRHLVLYAHGGLVDEDGGIRAADRMIDWWLANRVYPVHITWESGAPDTIVSFLRGQLPSILPFGGPFDGIWERVDRKLEQVGRSFRPLWEEMKRNARAASGDLSGPPDKIGWKRQDPGPDPGVSLFIEQLVGYVGRHPGKVKIHLVGHSAGAVVLASALRRLVARGIEVESMQLMGGAIRVDEFIEKVVPQLAAGHLRRFTAFDLTDEAEQNDQCPGPPIALYHKSLLYLVARSLEKSAQGEAFEVPMVGLSKYLGLPFAMPGGGPRRLVDAIGGPGSTVIAPNREGAPAGRSQASAHGDFDDDPDTMTAVLMRLLDVRDVSAVHPYPRGGMPSSGTPNPAGTPGVILASVEPGSPPSRAHDAGRLVAARILAQPMVAGPSGAPTVVGDAYGNALQQSGWAQVADAADPGAAPRIVSRRK